MIIYEKTTYSFNLPEYCGGNYVSVDVVYPNDIHQITFYSSSGQHLLFSVSVNSQNLKLLNQKTLVYIQARIKNETN
jgi:hypothetical protein